MSKFQVIILSIFVIFIVAGVFFFATFKGSGDSSTQLPEITIWGTFPEEIFDGYVSKINQNLATGLRISYTQKSPSVFSRDLLTAMARGTAPDAILVSADILLPHLDKITAIPYDVLSKRYIKDTFIQESEIYLGSTGINAIPFIVDPLVMYWNRDMFASAGIASYPKYWNDFSELNKKLTVKEENGYIRKSAVALGDFTNVQNAREILGTILMQIGNPVTQFGSSGGLESALGNREVGDPTAAINYFVQFVNPNGPNYSWNRGMPNTKTAFLSQTLATYFGFASELTDIRQKNSNLNFDVASIPQAKTGNIKATYGKIYGLSIIRTSAVQNGVFEIFAILTDPNNLPLLTDMTYLPSTNLNVIDKGSIDPYITIFNNNALIAKTWIDADSSQSNKVLGNMINAITSGAKDTRDAIDDANDQYNVILRQAVE